jgi:hypothetical protein
MQETPLTFDTSVRLPKSETLHRVFLTLAFLLALLCFFLTYLGVDTYIDSGRSLFGDTRTAIGYQWKKESCDVLFDGYLSEPVTSALREQAVRICGIARSHNIPPVALRAVIGKAPYTSEDRIVAGRGADLTQSLVMEIMAGLKRDLPRLEQQSRRYRRMVSCMWFFFPGALGAVACYYYSRRFTPVLFAVIKRRFERIMFGRNRYSDAFDELIKLNKKQR